MGGGGPLWEGRFFLPQNRPDSYRDKTAECKRIGIYALALLPPAPEGEPTSGDEEFFLRDFNRKTEKCRM